MELNVLGVPMTLVETTAPARYDYGGFTVYGRSTPEKDEYRQALIPTELLSQQFPRYASGLYTGKIADDPLMSEEEILTFLRDTLKNALSVE